MKNKNKKKTRFTNPIAVAMRKRFPRSTSMQHRANRRAKDARNHWSNDQ
ncbi:MAG: hypothetical protein NUW00_04910 [Candidatus Kaiserbacteria bacterium]|nr:hypothetical protein [Candidatus Kaiserbacteria bacterium]